MDSLSVRPISFKGAYKIQGPTEVLDEICWYLQKKRKNPDKVFDFLDIRVEKASQNETTKILNWFEASKMYNKETSDMIVDHLLDLFAIRDGRMKPFPPLTKTENIDLFLTQNDKKMTEPKMINMVEDSLVNRFKSMNFDEKAKVLLENLSKMRNSLSNGKPILNINQSVIQKQLDFLKLPEVKILQATDVFEQIKNGSFDISNGIIKP